MFLLILHHTTKLICLNRCVTCLNPVWKKSLSNSNPQWDWDYHCKLVSALKLALTNLHLPSVQHDILDKVAFVTQVDCYLIIMGYVQFMISIPIVIVVVSSMPSASSDMSSNQLLHLILACFKSFLFTPLLFFAYFYSNSPFACSVELVIACFLVSLFWFDI